MNKIVLLAGVACLCAANVSAANYNPYLAAKMKYVFAENNLKMDGNIAGVAFAEKAKLDKNVWGASIAAGIVNPAAYGTWRLELEYTKNSDAKKIVFQDNMKVKTQAGFVNMYYDFKVGCSLPIMPYIGGGLGWGNVKFSGSEDSRSEDDFAYNIGAGVAYELSNNVKLDLGYRYVNYGKFEETIRMQEDKVQNEYKARAHEILLGLRYTF